jgi:hypothetical protein
LPSDPKIFHGRESEVTEILAAFSREVPRIMILGPGGIGKTSLAKAVLHHPEIWARYEEHRIFVPCDSASNKVELASIMGAHLGLKAEKDLSKTVVHHFARNPPRLLILDNMETAWEPTDSRRDIEEFLSLLADSQHVALIVGGCAPIMGLLTQFSDHNACSGKT